MSDMLYVGASGLRAYQTAIGTTSENIANAGTVGYSRRAATIREVPATNGLRMTGNGAFASDVARSSDSYRVAEARVAHSDLARSEAGIVWLNRVESGLTGSKLDQRLTAFFNAAKAVAADPAATAPRAVLLEQADALAGAFAATGASLATAHEDLALTGRDAARDLADLGQALYKVNQGIARASDGSAVKATLLDERDRVLEAMSGLVDLGVEIDARGVATVRAGGAGGPVLVDSAGASAIEFALSDSGTAAFTVLRFAGRELIPAHGGTLAGIVDGAQRLGDARAALDDMATAFVDGVNAVQAGGRDLDGNPGALLFTQGDPPTNITRALTSPRGVAAAAIGEGSRGNGNIAAFEALRADGGFEASLADLTTGNAAALAARREVATAQGAIRDAAVAARDAVSGVDLDEEAVNLIRFQQAYQASSRVIQVARETLQAILDIR